MRKNQNSKFSFSSKEDGFVPVLGNRDEAERMRMALLNMLEDTEEARKKTEEEKNKTLAIINNFSDGLLVFDRNMALSLVNPQAEKMLNVKSGDIAGKSFGSLGGFLATKPLADVLRERLSQVSRKELPMENGLFLEVSTIPLEERGEKLGSLIILHDISREKRIEKMKTEFVSLAAHQLRTPLSAIKWTLRMILDGDVGRITSEQKGMLEKTYKSNERMISLINDLLDVTRIEEGKYLFKPVALDIDSMIRPLVDLYSEEAAKRNIKIDYEKEEGKIPTVIVDTEKIKLVLQNLIDNAIKYTPKGGKIKISLKRSKDLLEIIVRDNGVGIPSDQQERVFSKFFRGANVMRMDTEGSGLGLFIAKNIIEAHGGKIWFESNEKEGTVFYVTLPAGKELAEFLKTF